MSDKNPGIIFDASNSWNGYNHQGKVALFVTIKTICDLWDKTVSDEENKKKFAKYFLEVEYYEDFSIGKYLDNGDIKYISVHQVKDKENSNIHSYDSAFLGFAQHFIERSDIEKAYLHLTTDLAISQKALSEHICNLIKTPKFIEDQLKTIKEKRGDANFRADLIKKKQGRRSEFKQNLLSVLEDNGAEKLELNESNLDKAFDLYKALLDKIKTEIASIDKEAINKIELFDYPISGGQAYCAVNEIRGILKKFIANYYNANPKYSGSYKCTDNKFIEKCYCFITDKLNEHIVDRDLNYHDYKCGEKDRKIPFSEIIGWLDSDDIETMGENYYLYYFRENMFDFMAEYCCKCKKSYNSKCANTCGVEEFKDKLAKMKNEQLRELVYHSNPQVAKNLEMRNYTYFVQEDAIACHFSEGLKSIERNFLSDKSAVTYLDNENNDCVLTTIRAGALDEESICSEILKNRNIYEMMMDCDFLISKDIDVDSIESKLVTPFGTENAKSSAHIARCKDVQIINLERFKDKIKGEE